MKADYVPALQPRGVSVLRCGHTDCCYYMPRTDSCDYLLIEYEPRGCPPDPGCARYAPVGGLRAGTEAELAVRVQAYTDMGRSPRQIARLLRLSESAVRQLRARSAQAQLKNPEKSGDSRPIGGNTP